jgi:hypothetical protein
MKVTFLELAVDCRNLVSGWRSLIIQLIKLNKHQYINTW